LFDEAVIRIATALALANSDADPPAAMLNEKGSISATPTIAASP